MNWKLKRKTWKGDSFASQLLRQAPSLEDELSPVLRGSLWRNYAKGHTGRVLSYAFHLSAQVHRSSWEILLWIQRPRGPDPNSVLPLYNGLAVPSSSGSPSDFFSVLHPTNWLPSQKSPKKPCCFTYSKLLHCVAWYTLCRNPLPLRNRSVMESG